MSAEALKFSRKIDNDHVHGEAREKILTLVKEIDRVYKDHIKQPSGKLCHICGRGDTNEKYKAGTVLPGYQHRPEMSPILCYAHSCGWRLSFSRLEGKRKAEILSMPHRAAETKIAIIRTFFEDPVLTDEETDLHFAYYLANQLSKAKHETYQQPQFTADYR